MKEAHRQLIRRTERRCNATQMEDLIRGLEAQNLKAWKRMRPKIAKVTIPIPILDRVVGSS